MREAPEPQRFRLRLQPRALLPSGMHWMLLEGYVRTGRCDRNGEIFPLGIWGPGEWVSDSISSLEPIEMHCLSMVTVERVDPSDQQVIDYLRLHIRNTEKIFEINRIRSAEQRLLSMLCWISVRFGQVNRYGHRLSLKELNLTHQDLAELCGLTRVTVTKVINRYKALGLLRSVGGADLLIPAEAILPGL